MKSIFSLLLFSFFVSCSPHDDLPEPVTPRHTLLVYLAGDNNLGSEIQAKTDSLLSGWNNSTDNLLIYQDIRNNSTPVLLQAVASPAGAYTTVIKEYSAHDSASPGIFRNIMQEAFSQFPAQTYGLLIFSHGTGWLTDNNRLTRTVIQDGQNSMQISDFAAAIPDGQFEYIVFEACLMSSVEVAYELRNKTNYIVASSSQILSPGFLPVYPAHLADLFAGTGATESGLIRFARAFYEKVNADTGLNRSATISVIATEGLEKLAALTAPAIQAGKTVNTYAIQEFNSYAPQLYFDFEDYIKQAATAEQYTLISEQLAKTVVYRAATPALTYFSPLSSTSIRTHCGLTVYIPQPAYPALNTAYQAYQWVTDTTSSI